MPGRSGAGRRLRRVAAPGRAGDRALGLEAIQRLVVVAGRGQDLARVLARAGPPRRTAPGVAESLTGNPSPRTAPAPGCSKDSTISRARTSSESSASSSSSTGSRQQSCSAAKASHSARVRRAKIDSTSAWAAEPGGSNWRLDEVLAPDARAPRAPELRLERPERDPAVGAPVGPVAEERPAELLVAPPRPLPGGEDAARRPWPATTARRRTSRRRRAGPRPCGRGGAAPSGSRRRP